MEAKSSRIILTFHIADREQARVELSPASPTVLTVGSQQGNVDIHLPHPMVSRVHAQVVWDGGRLTLRDNGSTNGTWIGGQRLAPQQPRELRPGDRIHLGDRSVRIGIGDGQAAPATRQDGGSLVAMLAHKPELNIGRQQGCDIVIDHPTVSRLHAKLRQLPDGRVFLIDLGSTNGSFHNGRRVQGNVEVKAGDQIVIGRSVLTLDGGQRQLGGEVAIRAEGISKTFPNGKVGLQPTHLSIAAGALVAIMGPSGCGKSTLLKCLTGEAPPSRGKVFLHNLELTQHYPFLKTLIGYVPQDDIVHRELTVEQSLRYAAHLRMERPTAAQIDEKIQEVLRRLRIDHIRHSPIAKISGGQRKRVSIAVELLTDPLILFLDEPTSPLDPQTIEEFLKILQELARKGTTVVMVTHKPEDLEYMDGVVFLAEGGAMVYDGPADQYKAYFQVRTAVEVYAAISGESARGWVARFASRHGGAGGGTAPANPRLIRRTGGGVRTQLWWLSLRYLRIKTNDLLNMAIMVGQAPIIAALICLIFSQVTRSVPFMITLSAIWFGTSNAAREIVTEAAVYRRERMFNLRIGPYILSKVIVLSLFAGVQALLFSAIIAIGFGDNAPPWHDLPGTVVWVWLLAVCATVLGLMISALVDSAEKAMTLVPLVLIPQVMLAGVVARIEQLPVELLSYLTPTRWGNEGLMLIQGEVHEERLDMVFNPIFGDSVYTVQSRIDSKTALGEQFPGTYEDIFGDAAYTLGLDGTMLGMLMMGMLVVVLVAMRRKDSL